MLVLGSQNPWQLHRSGSFLRYLRYEEGGGINPSLSPSYLPLIQFIAKQNSVHVISCDLVPLLLPPDPRTRLDLEMLLS